MSSERQEWHFRIWLLDFQWFFKCMLCSNRKIIQFGFLWNINSLNCYILCDVTTVALFSSIGLLMHTSFMDYDQLQLKCVSLFFCKLFVFICAVSLHGIYFALFEWHIFCLIWMAYILHCLQYILNYLTM